MNRYCRLSFSSLFYEIGMKSNFPSLFPSVTAVALFIIFLTRTNSVWIFLPLCSSFRQLLPTIEEYLTNLPPLPGHWYKIESWEADSDFILLCVSLLRNDVIFRLSLFFPTLIFFTSAKNMTTDSLPPNKKCLARPLFSQLWKWFPIKEEESSTTNPWERISPFREYFDSPSRSHVGQEPVCS